MAVVQEFRTEPVARGAAARLDAGGVKADVVADGEHYRVEVSDDDLVLARRVLGLDRAPAVNEGERPAWPSATSHLPPDPRDVAEGVDRAEPAIDQRRVPLRTVLLIWLAAFLVIPGLAFVLTYWLLR